MRGLEKDLSNYLKQTGRRVDKGTINHSIEEDSDEFIQTILKVIVTELESSIEKVPLDRVKELLSYIHIVLDISGDVDRKALMRKLSKLDLKLESIEVEQKRKIKDTKKAHSKIERISDEIGKIKDQVSDKETKKYDFMNYLIREIQNISYLECVLMKLPNMVNIRDKNHISLFQNTVNDYMTAMRSNDYKKELYYSNVLSLFLSQNKFFLSEQDKRNVLNILSRNLNQIDKNREKEYKEKIRKIHSFISIIKGDNTKKIEIETIAKKYNIPVYFERGILEQVNLIHNSYYEEEDRPLVDSYILTIDGAGTVEIDDGLSCEKLPNGNYLLGVHIASVLGYFPYESNIITEAIHRNQSIYLPKSYQSKENDFQKIIPIFPYDFSVHKASLIEGEKRLARSYFFELAKDGSIVKEKFLKTTVVNQKKTSFDEIDEILSIGSEDERLQETVENLQAVSQILDKRYKTDYVYEEVKEQMNNYADLRVKRTGSEKIIYQIMLLTGNRVAEFFANHGYPCLYRVHEMNDDEKRKIQLLLNDLTKSYGGEQYQQISQLIKGIYPSGWYDIEGHHMGLGVDHHCHCTSEIRRSADIVVEHALEECYDKIPTDKELVRLENDIIRKRDQINAKEEPINWFVREYKKVNQRRR